MCVVMLTSSTIGIILTVIANVTTVVIISILRRYDAIARCEHMLMIQI